MSSRLVSIEKSFLRTGLPAIRPGNIVRVTQRVREGEKKRLTKFEGTVIARKHGTGISATITIRKVVDGVGVERIFPVHSPTIEKIEILRGSKVRRAKLYYIREKAAREIRKKMKALHREDIVVPVTGGIMDKASESFSAQTAESTEKDSEEKKTPLPEEK